MAEYFLRNLSGSFSDISQIVDELGLKWNEGGKNWYNDQLTILKRSTSNCPIAIYTKYKEEDATKDPSLPSVKRVINLLKCSEVVNGDNTPYDMGLFR